MMWKDVAQFIRLEPFKVICMTVFVVFACHRFVIDHANSTGFFDIFGAAIFGAWAVYRMMTYHKES